MKGVIVGLNPYPQHNSRIFKALVILLVAITLSLIWLAASQHVAYTLSSQTGQNLTYDNPVPVITAITPTETTIGSGAFTLTITGTNFITSSVVLWNNAERPTIYITSTRLEVAINSNDVKALGVFWVSVNNPPPGGGTSNRHQFIVEPRRIFVPQVLRNFPPTPGIPVLNPIDNSDQDNFYSINWQNLGYGTSYTLEESQDEAFTQPAIVYQGSNLTWSVPLEGKLPGKYYYRVKTNTPYGASSWSNLVDIRIYPMYVGLKIRWDGMGYIRGSEYYDIGYHEIKHFDLLTELDTIRSYTHAWYDPNPLYFDEVAYYSYYSVTVGSYKSSSIPDDPSWKWGHGWRLPYDYNFQNGETVQIDGQNFTVIGPLIGYTSFGTTIQYWQFVNQESFLIYDDGGDWTQYVHAGEAILRYDAGSSRLLLYDNVLRHLYYQGELAPFTVQYITTLSAAGSLPGSPPLPMEAEAVQIDGEKEADIPEHEYRLPIIGSDVTLSREIDK